MKGLAIAMKITIIKQDAKGDEVWRYTGTLVEQGQNFVVIEAFFDREDMDFHSLCLCKGDRFVETYYFDRWYNIFEIHDRADDQLKGWYCNISSPATQNNGEIAYRDLALDLLVFPGGQQIVLDEDEFEALPLSPREHKIALAALTELQGYFREKLRAADGPP